MSFQTKESSKDDSTNPTSMDFKDTDIESLFSEEDEPSRESIFVVCHEETLNHSKSDDDKPLQFSFNKIISLMQPE